MMRQKVMDLKDVEVSFDKYYHGTDYDSAWLTYKNTDNYFFKNVANGETYRWSMCGNGKYAFYKEARYKISANVAGKIKYGIKITPAKVKELIKNMTQQPRGLK
jgi:hypothetical protein